MLHVIRRLWSVAGQHDAAEVAEGNRDGVPRSNRDSRGQSPPEKMTSPPAQTAFAVHVQTSHQPCDRSGGMAHDCCACGRVDDLAVLRQDGADEIECHSSRRVWWSHDITSGRDIVCGEICGGETVVLVSGVEYFDTCRHRCGGGKDVSGGDTGAGEILTEGEDDLGLGTRRYQGAGRNGLPRLSPSAASRNP